MRRFAAAAAGVLAALSVWVQPVSAAAPSVRINTPADHETLGDSTPNVSGDAQMPDGEILEVIASISSAEGRPVPSAHRIAGDGRASVAFSWTPSLPYNGNYLLNVRASGEDQPVDTNGTETSETSRSFAIEASPAIPKEVVVRADPDSREVDVTWKQNPEPDIIGYQIQRSKDEGEWSVAGETKENFFRDTQSANDGGLYSYRVVAIRSGAAADSGVASPPSEAASTTVPNPPGGSTDSSGDQAGEPDSGPSGDGSPGSGGGGGSGGSGGSGSGSSGGPRSPTISRAGRVDLSGFGSLLDQTRAPVVEPLPEPDPGFSEQLPFEPKDILEPEEGEMAVPDGGFGDSSSNQADMLRFFAAGLLVTVVLMHVLWLRGEVEKVPLEAVASNQS
ncbi:MAG TPA: hypothetical protein VMY88_04610 [Acidimicrobiales bacterium]|nr:hypothetical protein [Acidimicrobiales bacterium]